jgi:hypothetical protein
MLRHVRRIISDAPPRKLWIRHITSAVSKTILLTIGVFSDYSTQERNFLILVMGM